MGWLCTGLSHVHLAHKDVPLDGGLHVIPVHAAVYATGSYMPGRSAPIQPGRSGGQAKSARAHACDWWGYGWCVHDLTETPRRASATEP
eukprot:scaffold1277_cov329-Prasinococcus_capsulatus_cf.AAC.6